MKKLLITLLFLPIVFGQICEGPCGTVTKIEYEMDNYFRTSSYVIDISNIDECWCDTNTPFRNATGDELDARIIFEATGTAMSGFPPTDIGDPYPATNAADYIDYRGLNDKWWPEECTYTPMNNIDGYIIDCPTDSYNTTAQILAAVQESKQSSSIPEFNIPAAITALLLSIVGYFLIRRE